MHHSQAMSYTTRRETLVWQVSGELAVADAMPNAVRPGVFGGVEVGAGNGAGVSYADTAGKNSVAVVLSDLAWLTANLSSHPVFCGINIHDWSAWRALPP